MSRDRAGRHWLEIPPVGTGTDGIQAPS